MNAYQPRTDEMHFVLAKVLNAPAQLQQLPAFGEVEEGLFSACCENGLGTVKSTLAGIMAVDLATGQPSEALRAFMAGPGPNRLPPEPFTTIGASAVIRWQEFRAGREG